MPAKMIVLEDDEALRLMLCDELARSGYQVSAEASLAALRKRFSEPGPEVLLLDLNLPDGNSLTLMPEIKKSWPNTRVVILTGFATQETADAAFEQGEVFLLSKPFDSELLQGVIDMALAGKPRG